MSSPPLEIVIPVTERIDTFLTLPFCFSESKVSRDSKSLLIPIAIGIIPKKPRINAGTAKASKAANEEIITSTIIPRNCPVITLRANSPGVA